MWWNDINTYGTNVVKQSRSKCLTMAGMGHCIDLAMCDRSFDVKPSESSKGSYLTASERGLGHPSSHWSDIC